MRYHEYVPVEECLRISRLRVDEIHFRLDRLHKMRLLYRSKMARPGYVLNSAGYDCLALKAAVEGNHIESVGEKLGVGKESDVYAAMTSEGDRVAIKLHRLGRLSFRQVRRTRRFIEERRHISWLYASRLAAEREFEALGIVHAAGVLVPRPIARNRHLIVMGMIDGDPLYVCDVLPDPEKILEETIENLRKCHAAGIAHGDLSEYNIVITPELTPMIIDWPQYVAKDELGYMLTFEKDTRNLVRFFTRRFNLKIDFSKAAKAIGLRWEPAE